jgi:hypothetical protein
MRDGKVQYREKADRAFRLREAREKHFKSILAAARFHKWPSATLSSHERGGRAFKYDSAEKYAKAFGVDVDWLWNGSKDSAERALTITRSGAPASRASFSRNFDLDRLDESAALLKSEMEALGLCLAHAKGLLDLVQQGLEEYDACRRSAPISPKSPQEGASRNDCS